MHGKGGLLKQCSKGKILCILKYRDEAAANKMIYQCEKHLTLSLINDFDKVFAQNL